MHLYNSYVIVNRAYLAHIIFGNSRGMPPFFCRLMATSQKNSPGYEAFLVHLGSLRTAITDPGGLATELYAQGLIDRLNYQRANLSTLAPLERSQDLLSALDCKLASDESAFDRFLEAIGKNPVMEDVCTMLWESRGKTS